MDFDVEYNDAGDIISFIDDKLFEDKPEERVRQRYLKILHYEYNYSKEQMDYEVPIYHGSSVLKNEKGNPIRADIVIYEDEEACSNNDQGKIDLVVECKAPDKEEGYEQLVSYIYNTSASGGVWFNDSNEGNGIQYYKRLTDPENRLEEWPGIPRKGENWDDIGMRKKENLKPPRNIKGLLKRCHNKIHSRGAEEDDLTMDMVRIILAKARDEEKPNEYPKFYCTPKEYKNKDKWDEVAQRINDLFDEVKNLNSEVFEDYEKIRVGKRAIRDVVSELQDYQLLTDYNNSQTWDLMGKAYEEYTETYLKRRKGQFFTNRLVVDLLVKIIGPTPEDIVLDPAGGSGGFLTGSLRYVRDQIMDGNGTKMSKNRQLDTFRNRLFMVESSRRLVKVAKTAMILNGDGHTGMTQGDSLGDYSDFDETIIAKCNKGKPTIIFTNPPFAGTGEGTIEDEETLKRFKTGYKWAKIDGGYEKTDFLLSSGAPPEMLFFERCIDWLDPKDGKLGIVLPKGFLDTATYASARQYMFNNCKLHAVINLHKNTFQPHTGVKGCLVILEKKETKEKINSDYSIFMAISRKIGQDSLGNPIYKTDSTGNPTDELDHDLNKIYEKYVEFKENRLEKSEYCFSIKKSEISSNLKINPQSFMPSLNATLKKVEKIDNIEGWSVYTLGQITKNVSIYKGPRFKSTNLVTEETEGENIEEYYTPTALLQNKSDNVKYLDITKASDKQLSDIEVLRVQRGYICITRSGTIGRVTFITQRHDGVIASDDLIRVIVPDNDLRHYVYFYLQTKLAQDQFKMNEYGTIQQHLEPSHVKEVLIPIPDDIEKIEPIINNSKRVLNAKETEYNARKNALNNIDKTFNNLL